MGKSTLGLIAVEKTITIVYNDGIHGDDILNVQKDQSPDLFKKIWDLAKDGTQEALEEIKNRFFEFKSQIESYTKGNFLLKDGALRLIGDDEEMPKIIAIKLRQMYEAKEDFMPLIRFWKKLKLNPDQNVREQLYGFMNHNHIPITPLGDVICEKGVKETEKGTLVDCHTGKIDNSIGLVVEVPREEVDPDPNQTCSHGLHVGAPDYVRKHWTSDIIVDVEVDPKDFVAVPRDYNDTKARVCRYKVMGLAKESKNLVYQLEDIVAPTMRAVAAHKAEKRGAAIELTGIKDELDYNKMTAKAIMEYVEKTTGVKMTQDPKNKKQIIKHAQRLLAEHAEEEEQD